MECFEVARKAVEHDKNEQYDFAEPLYRAAAEQLENLLRFETCIETRKSMIAKVDMFLRRADDIACHLNIQTDSTSSKPVDVGIKNEFRSSSIWGDICGLEEEKGMIKEITLPVRLPKLFRQKRRPCKGFLLYGLHASGKTMLVKGVASLLKESNFVMLDLKKILYANTVGQGKFLYKLPALLWPNKIRAAEEKVRTVFENAKKQADMEIGTLIFIDEIHMACIDRGPEKTLSSNLKHEILNGMKSLGRFQNGIVAASNNPQALDASVRRRFTKRIHIPLPNAKSRTQLIIHRTKQISGPYNKCNLAISDATKLTKQLEYWNCEEIIKLVDMSLLLPKTEYQQELFERLEHIKRDDFFAIASLKSKHSASPNRGHTRIDFHKPNTAVSFASKPSKYTYIEPASKYIREADINDLKQTFQNELYNIFEGPYSSTKIKDSSNEEERTTYVQKLRARKEEIEAILEWK